MLIYTLFVCQCYTVAGQRYFAEEVKRLTKFTPTPTRDDLTAATLDTNRYKNRFWYVLPPPLTFNTQSIALSQFIVEVVKLVEGFYIFFNIVKCRYLRS